ncbi:hypothetical protein THAOC_08728, partial [Thalassiosira oceanica]
EAVEGYVRDHRPDVDQEHAQDEGGCLGRRGRRRPGLERPHQRREDPEAERVHGAAPRAREASPEHVEEEAGREEGEGHDAGKGVHDIGPESNGVDCCASVHERSQSRAQRETRHDRGHSQEEPLGRTAGVAAAKKSSSRSHDAGDSATARAPSGSGHGPGSAGSAGSSASASAISAARRGPAAEVAAAAVGGREQRRGLARHGPKA